MSSDEEKVRTNYKGTASHGMEILVTVYNDGEMEVAFRREPMQRWSPAIALVKVTDEEG